MNTIWNFIFRKLPIIKQLDGHKTTIGAGMTVLAGLLELFSKLAVMYPEAMWLTDGAATLEAVVVQINHILTSVGMGFMTVGLIDKKVKSE